MGAVMLQGTGSDVGKPVPVSNNTAITSDGGEIGRARGSLSVEAALDEIVSGSAGDGV